MGWRSRLTDAEWEVVGSLAVLAACPWVGRFTGWRGSRSDILFTKLWPFYVNLSHTPRFSGRVLFPLCALACVWFPLRRWVRGDGDRAAGLCGVLAGAYLFHLGLAVQHHGIEHGLAETLYRGQEYWQDLRYVTAGFLARFPEVGGPLSQHGSTHPPGYTLLFALVRWLGFSEMHDAELAWSLIPVLTALPLYGAARRLLDEQAARFTVALFLFACVVSGFAVMASDTASMLLSSLALYGLALALDGRRWGGVLWGTTLAAASLCTFLAAGLVLTYGALLAPRWRTLDGARRRALLLGPLSFFAAYAVLMLGFGYRPFHVLAFCVVQLATSDDMRRSALGARFGNPIAFLGALGLPLAGLTARAAVDAVRRVVTRPDRNLAALVIGALLPIAVGALAGKPRGEVEHVYLLFVPATVMAAAGAARRWYGRSPDWLAHLAVPLAALSSILIEVVMDTYW
jgi:hypothetical protein